MLTAYFRDSEWYALFSTNSTDMVCIVMTATRARFRLMRGRVRSRWRRGLLYAPMMGTLLLLLTWAGYHSPARGWGDPIEFSEALPAFPIGTGTAFLFYVLWPWRHSDEDTRI
jgi:hypothetical protein